MTGPGAIPQRPVVKQHLHLEVVGPNHLFVLGEDETHILSGDGYVRSVALLDGRRTVSDVVTELQGEVFPPDVYTAIHVMAQTGLLIDGLASGPRSEVAFWHAAGVDTAAVARRLEDARSALVATGSADARPLAAALQDAGVQVDDEGPDLLIVATDHYLEPALAAINEEALARGRPWMTVKLTGRSVSLGPIFRPGLTGCWSCLAQGLRDDRQVEDFYVHTPSDAAPPTSTASLPTTVASASSLAALFAATWLVRGSSELEGQILTLDTITLRSDLHPLVRQPQCPSCGDPQPAAETGPTPTHGLH